MQILATMLVVVLAISDQLGQMKRSEPVLVKYVLDGDTIDVSTYGRVRLLGIDAPEISHGLDTAAPFGREARERMTALVLHRWVRLEQEGPLLDAYKRRLAYVITEDGTCVNETLVREGLARVSARLPLSRLPGLKHAEGEAQQFRRGMWGEAPAIPSSSYTRPRPKTARPAGPSKRRGSHTRDASHPR